MRLLDKVALITGAGGGIGRAAALLFAKEGAKVVVNDCKPDIGEETTRLIQDSGYEALFVYADVSKAREVEAMIQKTVATYGKLDVLYNNAAIGYSTPITHGSVVDIAEKNWDAVIDNNLKSVYFCCKYAIPEMIKGGGGSIINTSSIMALRGVPGADAYTAAKGGIIALSRALAKQFGPQNIRVNVLCPGTIDTPMIAAITAIPEERKRMESVPLGRLGTPEDVAYAALYLASDESSFTTGAILVVDGGRNL